MSNQRWGKLPENMRAGSRLYNIWCSMKSRCKYKNPRVYKYYGAKGIYVCDEWLDYGAFCLWAIDTGYAENLTIDRIDNSLGYSPANCRWATKSKQAVNREYVKQYVLGCFSGTLGEWARLVGRERTTLYHRMQRGLSFEEAVFINPKKKATT